MHNLLRIISFLFIVLMILGLIQIPKSLCQDQQYLACSRGKQCGSINIFYPFWNENQQNSGCGYPGFQVSCQADVARIIIGQIAYRILYLNPTIGTVTVARDDLWNTICPTFIQDTTLDFNRFSYSSNTENLTLSYGCTSSDPGKAKPSNEFDCIVNNTLTSSFFNVISSNTTNPSHLKCNSSIHVPVPQDVAQNLKDTRDLTAAVAAGFPLIYKVNNSICQECLQSGGRCGYNNDSQSFVCFCFDRPYNLACNESGSAGKHSRSSVLLPVILVTVSLLTTTIICYLAKRYSWWKAMMFGRSLSGNNHLVQEFMRSHGSNSAPKLYTYLEIKKMTSSFKNKLGHGGYGCVYKGKLSDGRHVAVKVLNDNKGNGREFINEVAAISKTSHVNVVSLLGFCYNSEKRALIYEFMPNGSLDKFISQWESSTKDCLEWKLMYKIAVGTARGLEYLHQGCNTRIVHFDIKPQNILLDADFCPKISDFGLAKLYKRKESILSTLTARGTVGYIAPEILCRNFGGVSHKSDVYSYGMMVLEMVGLRRKPELDSQETSEVYFPNWIYDHVEVGNSLPVEGAMNEEEEETAMKMVLVGLWCIQTNPADRPSISKVVEMLEGNLQSLQIPPRPFLDSRADTSSKHQESWTTSLAISEE